ncbi:histidine phosphatase family protein [Pontibacillus yanchengensis]|uniref:Phosphoglycerate mutase n=1 Tax=Pontibacillus yanchengensis Y32 TaxID=1385514 RepID=A0A0A2T8T5_9BACI|nr:histidine phosphatase family protein [Pontibacillus yanchengensis]KGP71939.1 phosphoglycerate mutase [Pontibacillus yanchengensis Y32]
MKLGLVRHGSTAWNQEGRAQGSSDIPLDEEGKRGARKLADRLAEERWDVIYASDLARAAQTADIIGEKIGVEVRQDPRLREASGGLIEGTTEEERIEKWGPDWRELDLGVERADVVVSRALSILKDIHQQHKDMHVLIVSHGALIKHLLHELQPDFQMVEALRNNSLTILQATEQGWKGDLYNCTNHLQ